MDVATYLHQLEQHGHELGDAAQRAGLDTAVPPCPDWDVRALLAHVGMVHRWATGHVVGTEQPLAEAPADGVVAWYRDGHRALLAALRAAPADLEAMTFLPGAGAPREFWARRQAHETAVHHIDAAAAGGEVPDLDPDFALDGIGEILEGFHSRGRGTLLADPAVRLRVAPSDANTWWRVTIGPDGRTVERDGHGRVDCMIVGASPDVYLTLWNRTPAGEVTVSGGESVMTLWRERAHVRWS